MGILRLYSRALKVKIAKGKKLKNQEKYLNYRSYIFRKSFGKKNIDGGVYGVIFEVFIVK